MFIVYDITDRSTFNAVRNWINDVRKHAQKGMIFILIGNKRDLEEKREVSYEEGQELA